VGRAREGRLLPLITRDPATGAELIVTRLESPTSGVVIEGEFGLGWIAMLSSEQLEFVGAFLKNRGNVQRLAAELGVSYNTARSRLDDIVRALGAPVEPEDGEPRAEILDSLAAGEIDFEEAMRRLRGEE
jgi:hypothetical protein